MLQLKNIKKTYVTASEQVEALKGVDLSFRQKEFVSILGPSGCGKTTMLNIIGGLDHYTSGDLTIIGKSTKEYTDRDWDVYRNHRIGFIFQSYNLIPHQTILGNVELALTIAGISKEERQARAKRALDRVGLAGQYNKRPNQLSGGQCQRVAIARALVNDPEILLADEPTGALDTVTSKQIMDLIREISGERLVIMVTHNPEIAEEYSSRIIRLLDGNVIEDTNPYSAEDEERESLEISKAEKKKEAMLQKPKKVKEARKKINACILSTICALAALLPLIAIIFNFAAVDSITENGTAYVLNLDSVPVLVLSVICAVLSAGAVGLLVTSVILINRRTVAEKLRTISLYLSIGSALIYYIAGKVAKAKMSELSGTLPLVIMILTVALALTYLILKRTVCADDEESSRENAKMSFFTAFRLSARNLLSKKGRTTMVGIAGSIGIIGIATVLAFSAGIKGFVASMQDDMLSGNPIEISETGFNAAAVNEMMTMAQKSEVIKEGNNRVYITSLIQNLAEMNDSLNKLFAENTLTAEYMEYVKSMPEEYYNAIILNYGINMSLNVYTDFTFKEGDASEHLSIKRIIDNYTSALQKTQYAQYSAFIPYLAPSMSQAPSNEDYILSQYELVGNSKVATEMDEVMLVLNADDELSDLLLAAFGYYTQEEFLAIVDKATSVDPENYNSKSVYREYFEYDELLGKELVWYPTDAIYKSTAGNALAEMLNGSYMYSSSLDKSKTDENGGVKLKVVGILTPKDNISFGALSSGIYYTEELTNHVLETNAKSTYINNYLMTDKATAEIGSRPYVNPQTGETVSLNYTTIYSYTYYYDDPTTPKDESLDNPSTPDVDESINSDGTRYSYIGYGFVSPSSSMRSMMGSMFGGETSLDDHRQALLRNLGGNAVPNHVMIYPKSFEEKNLVTDYLDAWNESNDIITVDGKDYAFKDRTHVTYTDTLELVISVVNTMIDVITYALIAFTSISLVVSTVMIGIITYVSVVERIKEIGVIRSLGGRKKDVSHLFNAETFIIGLLAGLIGVFATYVISFIVNIILTPLINYSGIAALPVSQAIVLVALSIALTCISGLIPAKSAANKDPVVALRTE